MGSLKRAEFDLEFDCDGSESLNLAELDPEFDCDGSERLNLAEVEPEFDCEGSGGGKVVAEFDREGDFGMKDSNVTEVRYTLLGNSHPTSVLLLDNDRSRRNDCNG